MYAIAFDMDIESLKNNYGDPYNNAYYEIRRILQKHGFTWQQGSVYFGGEQINAVTVSWRRWISPGVSPGSRPRSGTSACSASRS